jgi:peptide chain release factor 3
MVFEYNGMQVNLLDTPGHKDFAEDTYRTLTAVDSVILVIDSSKGVEAQTRRLMEVCRMRDTPVIVFINKMDLEGQDAFDLLDELEDELNIKVQPLSWPISKGYSFKGVYKLYDKTINLFESLKTKVSEEIISISDLSDPLLDQLAGEYAQQLREDVELIESVYDPFDRQKYLEGKLAPVFFGSAMCGWWSRRRTSFRASCLRFTPTLIRVTATASPFCVCAAVRLNAINFITTYASTKTSNTPTRLRLWLRLKPPSTRHMPAM